MERQFPQASDVKSPIEYFRRLLSKACVKNTMEQSNLFACQQDPEKPPSVTYEEMDQFLGICFHMSIFGQPGSQMYRSAATRLECVANTMRMHQWEAIKCNFHFANNMEQIPQGHPGYDKLFKACPLTFITAGMIQSNPNGREAMR